MQSRLPFFGLPAVVVLAGVAAVAAPEKGRGKEADAARLKALDGTIRSLYAVISGPAGQKRDVARLRGILHPEVRHTFVVQAAGAAPSLRTFGLEDFLAFTQPVWERGFYEQELSRRTELFSHIAQVFSSYEVRLVADGPVVRRGINSFQFFFDGTRWQLVSAFWEGESEGNPIPERYLATR